MLKPVISGENGTRSISQDHGHFRTIKTIDHRPDSGHKLPTHSCAVPFLAQRRLSSRGCDTAAGTLEAISATNSIFAIFLA